MSIDESFAAQLHVNRALSEGMKFFTNGDHSAAVRCYQLALRQESNRALSHYLLGLTLMARGEWANARQELADAINAYGVDSETAWARNAARTLLDQMPDTIEHSDSTRAEVGSLWNRSSGHK